jgi:Chaperone of endosialidase
VRAGGPCTANANAVPVVIDSAGQLGTVSSSRRFKDHIEPMSDASEAIMGLKPVRFHCKTDKQNTPQFGLIAEEVAKINPDLVARDDNGEIYTVRYDAVNAMLLNEFLKERKRVVEQQSN